MKNLERDSTASQATAVNGSLAHHLKSAPATAKKFGAGLLEEMLPKVAFFFIAFGVMLLQFKLLAEQYSIEFSAFAKAAVAALILGKVVPLLDWAHSGHRFENHRRIVVIACKTMIYAVVVVAIGIGDKIFEAYRSERTWTAAVSHLIANSNTDRFLGLVLMISVVLAAYLTIQEIDQALGKGTLFRLLLERPADNPDRS